MKFKNYWFVNIVIENKQYNNGKRCSKYLIKDI